ncbi:hypothetical protein L1887_34749 [Cichorium endivia]|nr:hypothetical protein L1887_34749 [Cichorium endivia]
MKIDEAVSDFRLPGPIHEPLIIGYQDSGQIIKSLVLAFVRFMGDEVEARSYSYSLEVGGNGIKLIWEGTPRSIREHSIDIYCFLISHSLQFHAHYSIWMPLSGEQHLDIVCPLEV